MMSCKQFEVWLADLNPQAGTESGKIRPVLVVQTDLLNKVPHLSTLICPLTTHTTDDAKILRVAVKKGTANLHQDCDIMIDQIRAIDNKRLIKRIGSLPLEIAKQVKENLQIIFDITISVNQKWQT